MMNTALILIVCVAGIALSVKSTLVLGRAAPWTSAGWLLTVIYFIAVIVKLTADPALPPGVEYAVIVALGIAFVIAGVRDEPQAEVWWWPTRCGATRAERRASS
jgi:hypothetical protein